MKKIIFTIFAILLFSNSWSQTKAIKNMVGTLNVTNQLIYDVVHGAAYVENTTYTPSVTQNVYTKLTPGMTVSEDTGLTIQGDTIILTKVRDYFIIMTVTLSGANGDDYRLKLYKNNATTGVNGSNHITTTGATNFANLTYFWYLTGISANDNLSFKITNTSNNNDPTITDMKFYIDEVPEN